MAGPLTGGSAVTVSAGIATFSGLSIDMVGTGYTLTASSTPSYTAATSSTFNITMGAATHLAFIQAPDDGRRLGDHPGRDGGSRGRQRQHRDR